MNVIPQMTSLTVNQSELPIIGITMGDPKGIGAEVLVKALVDPSVRQLARFVLFGIEDVIASAAQRAAIKPFWFTVSDDDPIDVKSGVVVVDHTQYSGLDWAGAFPCRASGRASLVFLDAAVTHAKDGRLDAIVTGPINKTAWQMAGCRFPGHTEKLAESFKVKRCTMMFAAGDLKIALASAHVGLFSLRNQFTIGLVFQPIDLLDRSLRRWFGVEHPRIGVAALNPHAGEGGKFGDDETRVIEPAIQMAKNAGIDAQGPFPADTLFTPRMRKRFHGIVAMYHDQGLIPVKLLAFNDAVNVTLGLPIIRTSVDHGTAYDIAGDNEANPGSMKAAIRLACNLVQRERQSSAASTVAIEQNG